MSKGVPPPPPVQPPPPPTFTPPAKSSYHSKRQDELDAIRKKGLAKIFNKHFTTVATKIQHERAAAELALAELERRKAELSANPKSYSGGLTLTQLDKLHMELKKRKSEVFRKERETQELYKRYVSQYGGATGKSRSSYPQRGMPILHEHSYNDVLWQSDLMLAKATEKNEATKDSDVGKLADQYINDCANAIQGIEHTPSNNIGKLSGDEYNPVVENDSQRSHVYSSDFPQSPDVKKLTSKESKRAKPFDSPAPTSITSTDSKSSEALPQKDDVAKHTEKSPSVVLSFQGETSNNSDSLLGGVMVTTKSSNKLDDCDDSSTMSGLTTMDGATVVEAEWRLTEFLRIETENIRKMFADEDEAKNEGESDCNDLISDNSAPSIIIGEVHQAAKKAEEMVRQMEAATAWMQDPTLLDSDSDDEDDDEEEPEAGDDDVGSVPEGLEWRCFWSEQHKREYYYNTETGQTCWTKPQDVTIDFSTMRKGNNDDDDYNEIDSVASEALDNDGDSVTVKDYTKSRKILVDTQALNPTEFTNEEMIDVFRPDNDAISVSSRGSIRQSSKVLQYRRKRARNQRMKRRLRLAVCAMVALSAYYYYAQRKEVGSSVRDEGIVQLNNDKLVGEEKERKIGANDALSRESNENLSGNQSQESYDYQGNSSNSKAQNLKVEEINTKDNRSDVKKEPINGERPNLPSYEDKYEDPEVEADFEETKSKNKGARQAQVEDSDLESIDVKGVGMESMEIDAEEKELDVELLQEMDDEEELLEELQNGEQEILEEQKVLEIEEEEAVPVVQSTIKEQEALPVKPDPVEERDIRFDCEMNDVSSEIDLEEDIIFSESDNASTELTYDENMDSDNKQVNENIRSLRPLTCAIPFAYIPSKKCRELATNDPIFDCKALIDSMME